jgi:septum formation inhibitor-activating ATPase MinD
VVDALSDPHLSPTSLRRWLHQDSASGFWALLAPTRPDASVDRRLLAPVGFRRVLAAATDFDVVVFDCPVELADPLVSRFALRAATAICLVITNERATLVDARRALERITNAKDDRVYPGHGIAPSKIGLLVNQHLDRAGVTSEDIGRILPGYPIIATIPDDRHSHVAAANAAEQLALSDRQEVVGALDLAIGSLLPQFSRLPTSFDQSSARQFAQLQDDLQRERWRLLPARVRRLVSRWT